MTKIGCGFLTLSKTLDREPGFVGNQFPPPEVKMIALFQRGFSAPTFPGAKGCPGGIYEEARDASPSAAARREALEEANILANLKDHETPFFTGSMPDRKLQYFIGTWSPNLGEITFNDREMIGFGWYTFGEAIGLNLSFLYKEVLRQLRRDGYL